MAEDMPIKENFLSATSAQTLPLRGCRSTLSYISVVGEIWRQATLTDIPFIKELITSEVRDFFGDANLAILIEKSPYSVIIESTTRAIVGFICLNNYPNISALSPEVWMDWVKNHYKFTGLNYGNTLFVHYIVWNCILRPDNLNIYLQELFLNDANLEYICLVAPPNEAGITFVKNTFVKTLFSRALPFGTYMQKTQALHICFRSSLVTKMKIRRALAEDNDDLVEILDATAPKIRRYYGDYYIAEIVLKKEPNRSIIVAEINNQSVGLMCLNTNVDLIKLNENFELMPFNSLYKYRYNTGSREMEVKDIILRESVEFFAGIPLLDHKKQVAKEQSDYLLTDKDELDQEQSEHAENPEHQESLTKVKIQRSASIILRTIEVPQSEIKSINEFNFQLLSEWNQTLKKLNERETYYKEFVKNMKIFDSEEDAMAIELFGIASHLDERVAVDLIKGAFDTYPQRNYCLLTIPTTAYLPRLLNYFTRVIPRPQCNFPDNLYIIHRNNLAGALDVSFLDKDYLEDTRHFVAYEENHEIKPAKEIYEMCEDFLCNPKTIYDILMIRIEQKFIGLIILRRAAKMETLRQKYRLDDYENFEVYTSPGDFGHIVYCYMMPLFVSSSTFILKEIFRITGYKSLYYSIQNSFHYVDFYNTLLPVMFPIKPRREVHLPSMEMFEDIEFNSYIYEDPGTTAIYYTNPRLCAFQRKNVDTKIVIVGFGQTAKSFIETLIYRQESQHLHFTNLTCICPAGILESNMIYGTNTDQLFSPDRLFTREYLRQLELRVWVNFVSGYMSYIDRKAKYIVLERKERIPYDKLFLFCGVQFEVPVEVFNDKLPGNVILINKLIHGKMAHYKLHKLTKIRDYIIIVYGNVPKAYACVNHLLNNGVSGEQINFVIPPIDRYEEFSRQTFDDDFVETVMDRELKKAGVIVYKNFKFVMWNIDESENMIKSITFESRFQCVNLSCALFFSYNRKVVNKLTVKALNKSGLVFDGRIVIDANNKTNDPNIYAAGPLTKYRRILYADRYRHIYYNSREIGIQLAKNIVKLFGQSDNSQAEPFKWIVPHYTSPIVESIVLPGNYYYLHIRRPGYRLPNYMARTLDNYGLDMITGGPTKPRDAPGILSERLTIKWQAVQERLVAESDYCRIYINKNGVVETIVCLSRKVFPGQNMIRMWGIHEKLLNNMKCKYQNGEIIDFFKFLGGRWAYILLHDDYHKLQELNHHILLSNLDGNVEWLKEFLNAATDGYKRKLSPEDREGVINYYQSEEFVKLIQDNLLNFLNEHKNSLFMYANLNVLHNEYGNF